MTQSIQTYDEVYRVLEKLWREVLGLAEIDADADFFELGGDSMAALLIAAQAEEAGMDLPRSAVLRRPTLRSLTDAVVDPALFASEVDNRNGGGKAVLH